MRRPRALDLFCGAGGAAMGLHRAGFDVIGVDVKRQQRYPFRFIQADALALPVRLRDFDLIWASPPCQAHTALSKMWNARKHEDRIPETRALLEASGVPYVIENVPGAPLKASLRLCGTMFGLQTPCGAELRRHRYFETSFLVMQPECRHGSSTLGVYGGHVRDRCRVVGVYGESANKADRRRTITVTGHTPQQNVERNRVRNTYTADDARAAMGMPWATMAELSQAIPPAYSEHIGRYALIASGRDVA
ncbi:MAG TPA: DNA cytosine methyltransferase [Polyangia bacterium]|nr:DNA cytosine methyltransferase [Polyangia bacterium]